MKPTRLEIDMLMFVYTRFLTALSKGDNFVLKMIDACDMGKKVAMIKSFYEWRKTDTGSLPFTNWPTKNTLSVLFWMKQLECPVFPLRR